MKRDDRPSVRSSWPDQRGRRHRGDHQQSARLRPPAARVVTRPSSAQTGVRPAQCAKSITVVCPTSAEVRSVNASASSLAYSPAAVGTGRGRSARAPRLTGGTDYALHPGLASTADGRLWRLRRDHGAGSRRQRTDPTAIGAAATVGFPRGLADTSKLRSGDRRPRITRASATRRAVRVVAASPRLRLPSAVYPVTASQVASIRAAGDPRPAARSTSAPGWMRPLERSRTRVRRRRWRGCRDDYHPVAVEDLVRGGVAGPFAPSTTTLD